MPILPLLLSDGFIPLVSESEKVKVGHPLAKRPRTEEIGIDLAKELGVPIHKVPVFLLKKPGDHIAAGDPIAGKKNLFGKISASIVSTADGVVTRFERDTGTVYVKPASASETVEEEILVSPIEGTISLCNNERILIDTDKNVILGARGIGQHKTDVVMQLPHAEAVAPYHLGADAIGKIVVGSFFSKEVLIKGLSMGVGGIIVGGIIATGLADSDMLYLRERNSEIPIIEISEEDSKKVRQWHGKKAYVHGEGKTIILLQT
jgi:hypothetical protein